ncbi:MAG: ADP-ribosylglycohydrolase family protein, partial [Hyphomicrobiales bacterium]|nr:ADP-ribosylglycohydrolase family protein [Hyphomicrobiales bacterium]
MNKDKIIKRTYDTLAAIAWIGNQYNWDDMDDYIQTILIGESLVANRGFNHRDLVRRYRTTPGHIIEENVLTPSGAHQNKIKHKGLYKPKLWKGQIWKLLKAFDLNYKAKAGDGITDGSAMKVACIAPFYLGNFESLVRNTDKITLVTHNTIEARCAALLIVLRFRQIFLEAEVDNLYYLKNSLEEAVRILNIEKESQLFIKKLTQGIEITENIQEPSKLLKELSKVVGIA